TLYSQFENGRRQLLTCRAFPSRPRQFTESAGRLAVHHHLDIVKRLAWFPVHEPALWMIDPMFGVSHRQGAKSNPPTNATASSMTTTFWWCDAPTGWAPSFTVCNRRGLNQLA